MSKNDITGAELVSKAATDAYRTNYDIIFRKQPQPEQKELEPMTAMMESTPDNLIDAMFRIQNALNTKSYNTDWIAKGKTEEFDYAMAAGDEAHEFARSLPFQWWTKDKADRQNQVTELVDAWHFVMSQMIIDEDGRVEDAAWTGLGAFKTAQMLGTEPTAQKQMKLFVAALYTHNTPEARFSYSVAFFLLCKKADVSLNLLYARYIAKSTLNKFRVANGYKAGTYKKIWEVDGEKGEDNYFLSQFVDAELAAGRGIPGEEEVNQFLTVKYAEVVTNAMTSLV